LNGHYGYMYNADKTMLLYNVLNEFIALYEKNTNSKCKGSNIQFGNIDSMKEKMK